MADPLVLFVPRTGESVRAGEMVVTFGRSMYPFSYTVRLDAELSFITDPLGRLTVEVECGADEFDLVGGP